MTDREKVIKALECRLDINGSKYKYCLTCDYRHDIDHCQWACQTDGILEDALALLKAQEPRLVTESDFNGADEYGYIPVWTEEKDGDMYWECIPKAAITDPDGIGVLRYLTSRPTEAQREAVKWDAQEQRDYEAAVEMAEYCERYEPTYNADDGSM